MTRPSGHIHVGRPVPIVEPNLNGACDARGDRLMQAELAPTAEAPADARRALEPLRPAMSPEASSQLEVVVSELVSNAVVHSNDGPIELRVELEEDLARVEVCDHGEGFEAPDEPRSRFPEVGGFGLVLVDRLARRWGVRRDHGATVVWSELPR